MNHNVIRKCLIWTVAYALIECILIYVLKFKVNRNYLYIGLTGAVYVIINAFFVKYRRERLFVNGIISYITVITLGVLFSYFIEVQGVVAIGIAISIVDVLSFTRYGKHTMNAKSMSNANFMYKLIVYGKGKKEKLYPTYGIGDYLYYALWIGGLSNSLRILAALSIALVIGIMMNGMIVCQIHKSPTYKGIPATIIPFICIILLYVVFTYRLGR